MDQPRPPRPLNPTRRALLGAGVATLALSLALSIAPAWANTNNGAPKGSGGDAGTVKIRDASTGDPLPDTSNDPHVCAFSVIFEYSPATSGTWQILSWAPTGDGSQVSSGTWNTGVGGTDETDVMTLAAGHYRLEYQADGASNSRNKTFWVEDGCEASGGTTGGDQPSDSPSDPPSDSPTDPPTESPSDPGAGDRGQEGDVQGVTGGDQNGSGGSQPSDEPSNAGSQSSGGGPSAQPTDHGSGTQGVTSPAAGDRGPALPNTATTPASVLSPLLAALGLLMVIAAHPFIRRSALADRA